MGLAGQSVDDMLCGLLDAYNESLKDDPNDVVACLYKGMTLNKMSRYDEGFACLDRAVEIAPADAKGLAREVAYASKGMSMNRMRRYANAVSYYEKALKLNPARGITYLFMGNVLDNMERSEESIRYFDDSIRLGCRLPDVYYGKAHALNNCKRPLQALECLKDLLGMYPDYANGHYEMATSYTGEYSQSTKTPAANQNVLMLHV
ncbi:MAG: tetratricopeptide repeat protein [Nitrosopumilaceae archaeon]|nr:tetratricopeptide repeat protein [Nitrosopumilaceae archaeon]